MTDHVKRPKKRTKAIGTRFEYRVRDMLKGYAWEVFRSAGSYSCADLIAIKPYPFLVLLVQCKAMSKPYLLPQEKKELLYFHDLHPDRLKVLIIGREAKAPYRFLYYNFLSKRLKEIGIPSWLYL